MINDEKRIINWIRKSSYFGSIGRKYLPEIPVVSQKLTLTKEALLSPLERLWNLFLLTRPLPLPEQEVQHKEEENYLRNLRDKTYKFNDVLFKAISWLGAIVLLDGLRDATGYGLFHILEVIAFFAFCHFTVCWMIFPVIYLIRFFAVGSGNIRALIAVIVITIPTFGVGYGTIRVVPVMIKKIEYAHRCADSSPTNPVRGCSTVKKHSRLLF